MLALDGGCDRLYFGAGGFNRDSRFEPADAVSEMIAAVFFIEDRGHRLPDFLLDGKAEARGHYADDGHAPAVNSRCATDDSRIAAKAPPPQSIADDSHRRLAGFVLFFTLRPGLSPL